MSGHSKWSTIKRKKGALDAKRGKIFTKLIKEITVSARIGGGDPSGNPRLRTAIAAAKTANMPQDNISRAIAKGTGDLEGVTYEEQTYEAYGPGGVALLISTLTDNRNRTSSEVRHLVTKHGGNLAEPNSVAWMFEKKGHILVPEATADEDTLLALILDAGADDMTRSEGYFEILTAPDDYEKVRETLEKSESSIESAEITMHPKTTVKLEGKAAEQMLKMMEAVEDHEDVQNVYANFDISEEEMAKVSA